MTKSSWFTLHGGFLCRLAVKLGEKGLQILFKASFQILVISLQDSRELKGLGFVQEPQCEEGPEPMHICKYISTTIKSRKIKFPGNFSSSNRTETQSDHSPAEQGGGGGHAAT